MKILHLQCFPKRRPFLKTEKNILDLLSENNKIKNNKSTLNIIAIRRLMENPVYDKHPFVTTDDQSI